MDPLWIGHYFDNHFQSLEPVPVSLVTQDDSSHILGTNDVVENTEFVPTIDDDDWPLEECNVIDTDSSSDNLNSDAESIDDELFRCSIDLDRMYEEELNNTKSCLLSMFQSLFFHTQITTL